MLVPKIPRGNAGRNKKKNYWNSPSENFPPYHCGGGHGGYAISSSMQMLNRSYDKGGSLKWKSLLKHQIRKSRLLQRLLRLSPLRWREFGLGWDCFSKGL